MKDRNIRRADYTQDPYYRAARATAQDKAISYDALGVMNYLLSKPDNWVIQPDDLERHQCGRNKVYKVLRELMSAGYMQRVMRRDSKGRVIEVEYILHELKRPLSENQEVDYQDVEKRDITYKREEHNRDIAADKPPRKRKTDPLFDALAAQVFGVTTVTPEFGGRIAKLRKALGALEPDNGGRLATDIPVFVTWYKAAYPGASVPRDPVKFLEHWQAWRNNANGMSSFEAALRGMKIEEYKP